MSINAYFPQSLAPPKAVARETEIRLDWFAIVLPALMAILLALLPVIGMAARPLYLLVLLPLVVWTAVTNTERALYVYIAWCWMDGSIRGMFDYFAVMVIARDLILLLIVVIWIAKRLQNQARDPWRLPPTAMLIALFIINCILQIGNPYSLGLMPSLAGLKTHLSTLPLFFIGYDVFRRRGQVRSIFVFLTLATLVIALVSVVQYSHGREWTYAHFPGSKAVISQNYNASADADLTKKDATFKPPGTTTFGGGTGGFISLVLPLTFVLPLLVGNLRFAQPAKLAFGVILFIFIVAIFLNGVRSALVTGMLGVFACGLLVGGKLRVRVLGTTLACLLLGLIGLALSSNISGGGVMDRYGSLFANPVQALHEDRYTFFDQFVSLATTAPLGVGMGRVGAATMLASQLASDTSALRFTVSSEAYLGNMIAETGLLGALLIASIALVILWRGYQAVRSSREANDKLMSSVLLSILAVMFATFFVGPTLLGLPGNVVFWLFAAILLRVWNGPPSITSSPLLPVRAQRTR